MKYGWIINWSIDSGAIHWYTNLSWYHVRLLNKFQSFILIRSVHSIIIILFFVLFYIYTLYYVQVSASIIKLDYKDFGAPKIRFGFTAQNISIGMMRRLMYPVYRSHGLSCYYSDVNHWSIHLNCFLTKLFTLYIACFYCGSNSRAKVFFFILLVAQLVRGQTRFFKVQFCNRRAYLFKVHGLR